jgi:hypothetical protein
LTDTGAWIDWGRYDADVFRQDDDGTYVSSGDGSPLYLRCQRQDGRVIYVLDGAGDPYTYRLVPSLTTPRLERPIRGVGRLSRCRLSRAKEHSQTAVPD